MNDMRHKLQKILKECTSDYEVNYVLYYRRIRKELNGINVGCDTTCFSCDQILCQLKDILKRKKITKICNDPATEYMDYISYIVFVE